LADKGNIEDILREKLNGFEPTVDPAVWNAVSSQITPLAPVATGGFSLIKTAIIGLASTVLAGAVIWFSVNSKGENVRNKPDNKPKTESNQINSDIKSTEETIQGETGQIPGQQSQNNTVALENNQSQQVKSNVLLEDLNPTPSVETVSLQTNRETNAVQDLPSPAEATTEPFIFVCASKYIHPK
jgi:archaellum component FlaF (FlaF/FlaG flagellin family)